MLEPPRAHSPQDGDEHGCHPDDQVGLQPAGTREGLGGHAQGLDHLLTGSYQPGRGLLLQVLQVRFHLGGGLVALGLVLLHRLADDVLEFRWDGGIQTAGRRGLLMQDRIERGHDVSPGKRLLSGRHLVQHHSKGKQIAARIERFAPSLLRGHVNGRSRNHSHCRQRVFNAGIGAGGELRLLRQLCETKVQHLGLAVCSEKDIGGLNIAVNDAFRVGGDERICHLDAHVQNLVSFERIAANQLLQAFAFQLLHDDEGVPVVVLDVVNRADVGMIQLGGRSSLALESLQGLGIPYQVIRNKLEGNAAPEARIFGLVDHSHAPTAEFSQDAIVRNRLADHGGAAHARSRPC